VKFLAAAICTACLAVGAGTLGLVLVPVLALAGGGAQTSDLCGIPGDVTAALATIRQLESGNDYTAQAAEASASGAYQFLDSSWRTWSARAGYPDLYPRAYMAPPHVQDAAAAAYVLAILDQWHDVAYVPVNWYYPAAATNPALMDIVPAREAGNRLTVRQYQTRWLELYHDKLGVSNAPAAQAGSCSTGDVDTVIAFARTQLGKPYVFAAAGPDAYDCSGLTLAAYRTIGIQLPHSSELQARLGVSVPLDRSQVRAGDLLFYFSPTEGDLGHVAIAISSTEEIQAPHTGDVVKITPVPYARIQTIRRLVSSDSVVPADLAKER
jgi:cell wall-associated NlpC family hydrolase